MTDPSSFDLDMDAVEATLWALAAERTYVKAKDLAREMGESSRMAGVALREAEARDWVEPWRETSSNATTYRITLGEGDDE